jgi:hypothetical protein
MIKKVTKTNMVKKQRAESKLWNLSEDMYTYDKQLLIIKSILNKTENCGTENNEQEQNKSNELDINESNVKQIIIKQINKKISGYKQQDVTKKVYNEEKFISYEHIVNKLIECDLKCRYCNSEMLLLYDITRESKQWTVDRVDNNLGHNNDNYFLSCLDCNLKKKRKSDEKFLFTKQLNIIKN